MTKKQYEMLLVLLRSFLFHNEDITCYDDIDSLLEFLEKKVIIDDN